jgi:hypothetical protein
VAPDPQRTSVRRNYCLKITRNAIQIEFLNRLSGSHQVLSQAVTICQAKKGSRTERMSPNQDAPIHNPDKPEPKRESCTIGRGHRFDYENTVNKDHGPGTPYHSAFEWHRSYYFYYSRWLTKDYFFLFNWLFFSLMRIILGLAILKIHLGQENYPGTRKP